MKKLALLAALAVIPMMAQAQDDLAHGEAVYDKWCAICHAGGMEHPGTMALTMKYQGRDTNPVIAENGTYAAPMVEYYVRNGVSIMPFFRHTEISDDDLAALAAYLGRNIE